MRERRGGEIGAENDTERELKRKKGVGEKREGKREEWRKQDAARHR